MKTRSLLCLLALTLAGPAQADLRLDALLQQGVSEYEYDNHEQAFEHFSAALTYAVSAELSRMYPGVYLCAAWYHGKGVEPSRERADAACSLTHGDLAGYQLALFLDVLDKNSGEQSSLPQRKAMRDAATALGWYMRKHGLE